MSSPLPVAVYRRPDPSGTRGPRRICSRARREAHRFSKPGAQVGAAISRVGPRPALLGPGANLVDGRLHVAAGVDPAGPWPDPEAIAHSAASSSRTTWTPLAAHPRHRAKRSDSTPRSSRFTRRAHDKLKDADRATRPICVARFRCPDGGGGRHCRPARWIDASGTWRTPNPLGASGVFCPGRVPGAGANFVRHSGRARRSPPALLGIRRMLVVGSGHSAFNVLARPGPCSAEDAPSTSITLACPAL